MAKVNAPLLAFNRGEVAKRTLARVDIERMRLAAECQVNWLPSVDGSMMLRPGTSYLFSTRSDAASWPVPFVYGVGDTALLEFSNSQLRVIRNDALITRASVSTTVTNGDFSSATGWTLAATDGCTADINSTVSGALYLAAIARGGLVSCLRSVTVAGGDQATEHALRIVVTRGPVVFMLGTTSGGAELIGRTTLDTGTHSLTFTPNAATVYPKFESRLRRGVIIDSITVEASGTLDLPSPYVAADLSKIRHDQSGDIVFIAAEGYQQRKVERRSATSWSIVTYQSDDGPFVDVPTDEVTLTPSVYEGNGTLTASVPMFVSSDVGKLFRIFSAGQTNQAVLGAAGAATEAIRVSGVGNIDRVFDYVISGTFVATVVLDRSLEGPTTGFKECESRTVAGTFTINDSASHNNMVVWYRMRVKAYTSGSITASFSGFSAFGGGEQGGKGPAPSATSATSGRAGICRVTSFTSATVVNIEVLAPFSSVSASSNWQPGEWNAADGWPTEGKFHEGRLFWFRGDKRWGSESDNYYSFAIDSEGDSAPINRTFGSGPVQRVNCAVSLVRLIVGREMSIDPIRSSSFEEPLTPTNNTAKSCTTKGAHTLPALKVGNRAVYVEKSERKVYELAYSVEQSDYRARDLTRLNPDIGIPGFVSLAVQEQPDTYLHFVRGDGQDAVLLFEPDDEVACWFRMQTLGVIENVVVLPGEIEDAVYFIVKRTINSSTKRYWEKMSLRSECVGGTLSKSLDCHLSVSQSSATTITGLSHLEGQTVSVWANGKDLGSYTVASNQITGLSEAVTTAIVGLGGVTYSYDSSTASNSLTGISTAYNGYPAEVFANGPSGGELKYIGTRAVSSGALTLPDARTAKKIIAYLGFYAPFRSAKLAYGAQMGTALGQSKKVEKIGLIAFDFHYQGLKYGSSIDDMQPMPLVEGGQDTASDTVWDEYDRPLMGLSGDWNTDKRLHLLAQAPKPVTLSGVVVQVNTQEK